MANTSADGGYLTPVSSPPTYDSNLDHLLQAVVVGITGLPGDLVRRRWQHDPPKRPPLTTNWSAIGVQKIEFENMVALHSGTANNGQGDTTTTECEMIYVLATFYGPNCWQVATQFKTGLWIPQNREALFLVGAAVADPGSSLMSNSELIGAQWLPRVDMVFKIHRDVSRTYNVLNLLSADGTIHTVGGSTPPEQDEPWNTTNVTE